MTTPQLNKVYVNKVSNRERKTDEKVFKDTQKMMKKSEVRNADWGLEAAQNCLARDLVNCNADELALITAKMDFIQSKINSNLTADNDLSCAKLRTKAEIIPVKAEAAKAYGNVATNFIDSSAGLVKTIKPLNLVA